MSATILDFPCETALLQLEGYVLIAWRLGAEGPALGDDDWYYGLWKPANGKGWYESGYRVPASRIAPGEWPSHLNHSRASRACALSIWRYKIKNPKYQWHHLMSEAQAFPEKRRRYMRAPRMPAHAV